MGLGLVKNTTTYLFIKLLAIDPGKFRTVIRKELFERGVAFTLSFRVFSSLSETLKCFNHQTRCRHHEKTTSKIGWFNWDMLKRSDISVSKAMQNQICQIFPGSIIFLH